MSSSSVIVTKCVGPYVTFCKKGSYEPYKFLPMIQLMFTCLHTCLHMCLHICLHLCLQACLHKLKPYHTIQSGPGNDHIWSRVRLLRQSSLFRTLTIFSVNKSRYYSVQLGHLTLFETLMLKFP
jgi:hypothetical protein